MSLFDRFADKVFKRGDVTIIFATGEQRRYGTPEAGLKPVTKMRQLKLLVLNGLEIGDGAVETLSQLRGVVQLHISGTKMTKSTSSV